MAKDIFRKKSLERISSPEALNNYIKVATPSVWVLLVAIVLILSGVIVWGIFGNMESYNEVTVYSDGDETVCYVPEESIEKIRQSGSILIDNTEYGLGEIPPVPSELTATTDAYVLHLMGTPGPVWAYRIPVNASLKQGGYAGKILTGSVSPISYVTN